MVTQAREAAPHNGPLNRRITVVSTRGYEKGRKTYQLENIQGNEKFTVFNNSLHNNLKALNERVYNVKNPDGGIMPPPQPEEGHFDEHLSYFSQEIKKNCKPTTAYPMEVIPSLYSGPKVAVYTKALQELRYRPWTAMDSRLNSFVKVEKTDTQRKHWGLVVPRLIQPPSYRYSLMLATYIKKIDARLAKDIDKIFRKTTGASKEERTIMKGLNAEELAYQIQIKWDRIKDCVAIGLDASRFDQHVSMEALVWEHSVYKHYFRNKKERKQLKALLDCQLEAEGRIYCTDGTIKYKVEGTRASGMQNTTSGNCLISCAMTHQLMKKLNITNYALIDMGDDMVLFVSASDEARVRDAIRQHYLDFGFTMKVEETAYIIEDIEFCQQHPVYDGSKYVMMRDPRITQSKDAVSIKPLTSPRGIAAFMQSVAKGGLRLTGGLPVKQNYYRSLLKNSRVFCRDQRQIDSYKGFPVEQEYGNFFFMKNLKRGFSEVHWKARASFASAFGIPPSIQILMESFYDDLEFSPCVSEGTVEQILRKEFHNYESFI